MMIQKHNRHMSFSIYICVLSFFDTVTLTTGKLQLPPANKVEKGNVFTYVFLFTGGVSRMYLAKGVLSQHTPGQGVCIAACLLCNPGPYLLCNPGSGVSVPEFIGQGSLYPNMHLSRGVDRDWTDGGVLT